MPENNGMQKEYNRIDNVYSERLQLYISFALVSRWLQKTWHGQSFSSGRVSFLGRTRFSVLCLIVVQIEFLFIKFVELQGLQVHFIPEHTADATEATNELRSFL